MSPADDVFEAPPGGFRFGPVHPGRTLADELKARPDRSCLGVEIARPREPHHRDHSGQARHFSRNRAAPGPVLRDGRPSGWLFKANTIWKRPSAPWERRSRRRWSKRLERLSRLARKAQATSMTT